MKEYLIFDIIERKRQRIYKYKKIFFLFLKYCQAKNVGTIVNLENNLSNKLSEEELISVVKFSSGSRIIIKKRK